MNKSAELNNQWSTTSPASLVQDMLPAASSFLTHPDEVLNSPALTETEKRAVLASWVSDARAVANAPALRQLDNGAVVQVDDVLHALRSLDDGGMFVPAYRLTLASRPAFTRRKKTQLPTHLNSTVRRDGRDNDDPPPSPAVAAIPARPVFVTASSS